MHPKNIELSNMRIEEYIQYSGDFKFNKIPLLKKAHYYVIPISLDGDAPKEYVKAYFYGKNCPRKNKPKSWPGYYVKFGSKSYPHESLTEFCINKIGDALGLKMNETCLAVINGQIRFLSKDFIIPGKKKLIHGVEILHEYFEDKEFIDEINKDRKKRRELLTFDVIENAFYHVHPKQAKKLLLELVKLITFDAIVGNNDRHFYNWGIIGNIRVDDNKKVEFTPIYDTARALLWNTVEEKLKMMYSQVLNGSDQLDAFINRSKPRFSYEGNPKANHFELINYLLKYNEDYSVVIRRLISKKSEKLVSLSLEATVFTHLSIERKYLIRRILSLRFAKLRSLNND